MKSEENKQINRFQFSTKIDRVEEEKPKKTKKTNSHKTKNRSSKRNNRRTNRYNKKDYSNEDTNNNTFKLSSDMTSEEKISAYKDEIKSIMDSVVIEDDDPTDDVDQYKEELRKIIDTIVIDDEELEDFTKKFNFMMDSIVIEDDDPTDDVDQYKEELLKNIDTIKVEEHDEKEQMKQIIDSIVIEDNDPTDDVDQYKEELIKNIDPIDNQYKDKIKEIMNTIVIEDDDPTDDVDQYKEELKKIMDTIVIEEEKEEIPTADFKVFTDDTPPIEVRDNAEEGISISAENIVVNEINEPKEEKVEEQVEEKVEEKDKESQAFLDELERIKQKGVHLNEAKEINLDHTLYRDQYFIKDTAEDKVVEEVKDAIENTTELDPVDISQAKRVIRRVYLSFQSRVILLIVGIILLFSTACFIIASALNNNSIRKVDYTEKSTINYEVCQNVMNTTNAACMKEGEIYKASTTSKIPIKYHYEAKFDEEIDYDLSYHVVVVNKIFDHNDANKILYEDETIAIDKTKIQEGMTPAKADIDVDIDFQKYYNFVNEYKQKYSMNADSQLNVILYIDDGSNTRNVGETIIPITTENYNITRNEINNAKQEYSLAERDWTNANTIYIIIGSLLVLLSLFLLFQLTKLALSVTGKKSKYQEYLMSLLNEYDRLIVIARDGYESNIEKEVVKVYTFDELLNARNSLNKPIIYSRINSIKSEFIVEDEKVIYKFILKEADMGE